MSQEKYETVGFVREDTADTTTGRYYFFVREFGKAVTEGYIEIDSGNALVTLNGSWGPFTLKSADTRPQFRITKGSRVKIEEILIKGSGGNVTYRLNFWP